MRSFRLFCGGNASFNNVTAQDLISCRPGFTMWPRYVTVAWEARTLIAEGKLARFEECVRFPQRAEDVLSPNVKIRLRHWDNL